MRRQAIDRLRAYYGAIGRAADDIADYAEKQGFLKAIYEDFYKGLQPRGRRQAGGRLHAQRGGRLHNPGRRPPAPEALRPRPRRRQRPRYSTRATGTGTFITSLIDYLPADRLEYKYLNEIHANEVAILPYYIANLNIEYTYREKTGRYLEFPNLCFVDTLDNMAWQETGATSACVVQRQRLVQLRRPLGPKTGSAYRSRTRRPSALSSAIPPTMTQQSNWNDFNPNRRVSLKSTNALGRHMSPTSSAQTDPSVRYVQTIYPLGFRSFGG